MLKLGRWKKPHKQLNSEELAHRLARAQFLNADKARNAGGNYSKTPVRIPDEVGQNIAPEIFTDAPLGYRSPLDYPKK